MSTELKNDWLKFCRGNGDFRPSDFSWLLIGLNDRNEMQEVVEPLPNGPLLLDRLDRYYREISKSGGKAVDVETAKDLVRNGVLQKQRALMGAEMEGNMESFPLRIVGGETYSKVLDSEENQFNNDVVMLVGDYVTDSVATFDWKIAGYSEACYG